MGHGPARPFSAIAAAAAPQHHLLTRAQLHALGLSDAAIGRWTRAGKLDALTSRLVRVAGAADTWEHRALAATMGAPPGTVLSHRAAAAAHRFRGYPRGPIEVTAPTRHVPGEGVRAHQRLLDPIDVTTRRGLPVTSVARTLIDLGAVSHPHKVGQAIDDARRLGLVTAPSLLRRLEEVAVQGRDGVRVVRALLLERIGAPLTATGFEDLVLQIIRTCGLPTPAVQWRVADGDFVAHLDLAYPEQMLAIEADSEAYHLDLHQFRYDRVRQNRLSLLGWSFLRFTDADLHGDRPKVGHEIAEALRRSGHPAFVAAR